MGLSPNEIDTLLETTGAFAGSAALWELTVSPFLKRRGVLPDRPFLRGHLTETQKSVQWLTPLTCDDKVPLPTLDELRENDHCVGKVGDVYQLITTRGTLASTDPFTARQVSPEFCDYYGTTVYIYKKPVAYSRD